MQSIIKTEDEVKYGLSVRHIFGLNIFRVNKVRSATDPRVVFLSMLCDKYSCSAHVGTLALEGEQPEEFFNPSEASFMRTLVGLHDGLFYRTEPDSAGSFFPTVKPSLLQKHAEYLLTYDALAVYVAPRKSTDQTIEAMRNSLQDPSMFNPPPPLEDGWRPSEDYWSVVGQNQGRWLHAALSFYQSIVLSTGDGWHFEVYAQEPSGIALTDFALNYARQQIEACNWYEEHQMALQWDDDNQCLKLLAGAQTTRLIT